MNELRSARACRYFSLTGPGSEPSRGVPRVAPVPGPLCTASMPSAAPMPCSVAKTSFEISVCTAIKSSEETRIDPPERTLCEATSSSCQLRSNPLSERTKLPASTNLTSSFCPTARGPSCAMGSCMRALEGRTTSVGMRANRAAMASASA
jgi:hypothetical protein